MRILLVVAALVSSACVAPQPVLRPLEGDDVTVFVHGYRGGFLKSADGELAYISIGEALREGDRSLALPFEGQRAFAKVGPLTTAGPLTKLTAVPLVLEEDAYGSFMDWAKDALPGFVPYAYDWRLDLRESGAGLCSFIESLGSKRRVRIVAHSMGGLVTLQCLRHGPESVRAVVQKVVFVGTPFGGAPGQWDDLHLGTKNSKNTRLMNAEALLTFPASWQLLGPAADFIFDEAGQPKAVPIFESGTWVEHKWGLFSEPLPPAYVAQLEARLQANREFWAGLGDEEGPAPTWKTMVVTGRGRDTVRGWTMRADGSFDFTKPMMGDGDGAVLSTRTHPPRPITGTLVESTGEHSAMLREREVQAVIADFVR